jgi:hypothetical protein
MNWPVLLTDAQPLPWSAQIVSEHETGQEAADAFDRLRVAMAQARDGETPGTKR